jgi:uncharacterized protein YcbK (DUF882 family)
MLLKPVTALALSAFVSFASFVATPAAAAPNPSSDSAVASSQVKGNHHGKKDKKSTFKKKTGHLASLHSAEPKESPKESPKLAASLSTRLDMKKVVDKHTSSSKKTTIAATGKETFIGGPTGHAGVKTAEKSDKLEKPVVEGNIAANKHSGKVAPGPLHASKGPMSKSGRAPSRHESVSSKTIETDESTDDHPVRVSSVTGAKIAPKGPCLHEAIEFVRGAETDRFPMTQCDGSSAPLATERLSVLVRPESVARPDSIAELAEVKGQEIAPGVRRIDPGLLSRLQVIADHFAKPGMPERVSIVSGYRPGSTGSYHASAQALDFHLEGVPNEVLVDFCKTLDNTGCGYYPNSSFVHVDVRPVGTGHVAWIDTSGPGEAPHYVSSWPPPPDPDVKVAEQDMIVNPYKAELPQLPNDVHVKVDVKAEASSINAPLKLKDWE